MISLQDIKPTSVQDAARGQLVIYFHGARALPALVVQVNEKNDEHGLLVFGIEHEMFSKSTKSTFLLDDRSAELCFPIGQALIVWPGDIDSVRTNGSVSIGEVTLGSSGAAIVGCTPPPRSYRSCWRVSDGARHLVDSSNPSIQKWELGILGLNGQFQKVVSFPYLPV